MDKKFLIVLKGTSCSGKSTLSNKIIEKIKITYLSSDAIAENVFNLHNKPNTKEVFKYLNERLYEAINKNENILIDATTLLTRYDTFYNNAVKGKGYETICICFDLDKKSLENNIIARQKNKWSHMSIEEIKEIVYRQKKSLNLPTDGVYNKVFYVKNNDSINKVFDELVKYIK